mgnify:CR=1 FL=1
MKGYKGFKKGLICDGKQYAENAVFKKDAAELIKNGEKGMRFCALPHEVFEYYSPGENHEFAEVEVLDEPEEGAGNALYSKELRIGKKISGFDMAQISVDAFFEKFDFYGKIARAESVEGAANAGNWGAANAGYHGVANVGDYGAANAGDYGAANAGYQGAAIAGHQGAANAGHQGAANAGHQGAANAGYQGVANAGHQGAANVGHQGAANAGNWGAANAGNRGAANVGYQGAANAGNWSAANAGDWGAANAGYHGVANAGHHGAANAGDWGAAIARKDGRASAGKNGIAVILGRGGTVKGLLGALLILTLVDDNGGIIDFKAKRVDGVEILEDTYYALKDGEFTAVEEANEQKD